MTECGVSEQPVAPRRQAWRWLVLGMYAAMLVSLAVVWREPSMHHWLDPQSLSAFGRHLLSSPLGPLAVLAGYVVAVVAGMPVLLLAAVGALIFPPWPGILWCLSGMVAGAVVTYGIGRYTSAATVDTWTSGRLAPLAQHLNHRGLLTMILVRVLPLAPFIVVNIAAGALRVRLRDYVLGSYIGLLPANLMFFLFMDVLSQAWRSPGLSSYLSLGALLAVVGLLFWWLRKKLSLAR
jgi:uncharacterized membrane protein YdjX (TVP38/TMEM64 family)